MPESPSRSVTYSPGSGVAVAEASGPFLALELLSLRSVALPTTPSSSRPLRCWNRMTASSVSAPNTPSATPVR